MSDHYDDLLAGGTTLLQRLSPPMAGQGDHCPEAADVVHDFLNNGSVTPVPTSGSTEFLIRNRVLRGFRRVTLPQLRRMVPRHGTHVVVRGVRSHPPSGLTPHHYFVLANIRGQFYVIDAYMHQLRVDVAGYIAEGPPGERFDYLEVIRRGYDVETHDPLAESSDPLAGVLP